MTQAEIRHAGLILALFGHVQRERTAAVSLTLITWNQGTRVFGSPVGNMIKSNANKATPSPETLKLIEAVLDYIRSNLSNIEATWGVGSPQYESASQLLDQYLTENLNRVNVQKSDLEELMQKMSLEDSKS